MASMERSFISKEIEDFATELYSYIWTKHRFESPSLQKEIRDELKLTFDKPRTSAFEDYIGNAVLCSQYLLRDFCYFKFKGYGCDLTRSEIQFCICVYDAIGSWINYRNNVFLEFIDCAAIAAEAVLFGDVEYEPPIELDRAPFIFKTFVTLFLEEEFYAMGGWSGLRATVYRDYHRLHLALQPYLQFQKRPYGRMEHQCPLIKQMLQSPVQFPFEISKICRDCETYNDVVCSENNDRTPFYSMLKNVFDSKFISRKEQLLRNIDEVKEDIKAIEETDPEQYESGNTGKVGCFLEDEDLPYSFVYVLLGKEDQDSELSDAKRSKKRTKKKKEN